MVCASNGLTRFNNVYDFFPCLSSSWEEIDPEGAVNIKSRSIDRERPTLRATVKVRRPSSGSQYVYIGNKASVPNQVQMQRKQATERRILSPCHANVFSCALPTSQMIANL